MENHSNYFYWISLGLILAFAFTNCNRKAHKPMDNSGVNTKVDSVLDTMLVSGDLPQAKDTALIPPPEKESAPLLHYIRGACFGHCPVYGIDVYSDGRLVFDGKMFTKRKGKYMGQLSGEELAELIQRIGKTGFDTLSPIYPEEKTLYIPDLPNKEITVQLAGNYHKVIDNHSAPEILKQFEKWVENTLRYHPSLKPISADQ